MEQQPAAVAASTLRTRAGRALRRRHNWEQLAKFCVVGISGYVVNLGVYALLLNWANLHYRLAATGSFLVAVTSNYTWNRVWTFRHQRGHVGYQGIRFFIVSLVVYGANLALLTLFVESGLGRIVSQAIAVAAAAPGLPQTLYDQLEPRGRLVVPVGRGLQRLELIVRSPEGPAVVRSVPCRFVPLVGEEGFSG